MLLYVWRYEMKKIICIFASLILLAGCAAPAKLSSVAETSSAAATENTTETLSQPQTQAETATTAGEATVISTKTAAAANSTVMKLGSRGDNVKKIQARLVELGYLTTAATGYYGTDTVAAVKRFQGLNGLAADGIAGSATVKKLMSSAAKKCTLPLAGYVIGIDPGHQARSNSAKEPVAPGSSVMKKKVSSGTQGIYTRVPEYKVNLKVGLKLRKLLEAQGATVVMTRTTNDVNISNVERAKLFNKNKVDYAIRLHCNGMANKKVSGAFMLVPKKNTYKKECDKAAKLLIDAYCKATGAKKLPTEVRSDQTGFNWCNRMIINIEMGQMSNKAEDIKLVSDDYENKMAQGLLNGIVAYFAQK